jgi:MFS family permease
MSSPSRAPWTAHPVTATVVGILASGLTVLLVESAGHALLGVGDPRAAGGITAPQYLAVLVAWVLGAALGALVATRWARRRSAVPGVVVGTFILLGAVASFAAFAHPLWMMAASAALPFVGFAAARLAGARPR